jgi:hypothetical protein
VDRLDLDQGAPAQLDGFKPALADQGVDRGAAEAESLSGVVDSCRDGLDGGLRLLVDANKLR